MSQTICQPYLLRRAALSRFAPTVNFTPFLKSHRSNPLISRVCTTLHVNRNFFLNSPLSSLPHVPTAPRRSIASLRMRGFHASRMTDFSFCIPKFAFTKPLLYRDFSLCTAKLYFFRESTFAPFCPTYQQRCTPAENAAYSPLQNDRRRSLLTLVTCSSVVELRSIDRSALTI